MIFGGFQPFTLTDFPGHVAAIAFTQGCNFRCPWCHNGGLMEACATSLTETYLLKFLDSRKGRLDGLVVSGGEPTIQQDLPRFLRRVKRAGFKTKLDTNGGRPGVLFHLLREGLLDFVAMDIKATMKKYGLLAGVPVPPEYIQESIALIAASGVAHEFRTTNVVPLLTPADLKAIRALVPMGSTHRIQAFRPELARDPARCAMN